MKAIILAAGRGSRLGERTRDRPKCMCTLLGRTLLDRCLDSLGQAGVERSETGIVTGYRSDMFSVSGAACFHNPDWAQTNMFYSLTMAQSWLEREPCIVCYSDIVFSSNTVRQLIDSPAALAIPSYLDYWSLWEKRMDNPLEDLETFRVDAEGRLLEIGKKPGAPSEIQGQFMGLLRFTPESWNWVKDTIRQPLEKPLHQLDMTTLLQELVQRDYPIQVVPTRDLWLECDTGQDIEVYERLFQEADLADI